MIARLRWDLKRVTYLEYLSGQEQVEQAVAYQDGRPGRPLYTYRLRDET